MKSILPMPVPTLGATWENIGPAAREVWIEWARKKMGGTEMSTPTPEERAATQDFTVNYALTEYLGQRIGMLVTPDMIEGAVKAVMEQIENSPTAWAFKP